MKLFTPDDFCLICNSEEKAIEAAAMANARLKEMVKEAQVVYSELRPSGANFFPWNYYRTSIDTHQARLICIEPIGKESGE